MRGRSQPFGGDADPGRLAIVGILAALLLAATAGIAAAQSGATTTDLDMTELTVNDPDGDLADGFKTADSIRIDNTDEEHGWIYNRSLGPGQTFGRATLNFSFDAQIPGIGGFWRGANIGLSTGPNGTIPGLNIFWRGSCNVDVDSCARIEGPDGGLIEQINGSEDGNGPDRQGVSMTYVHATEELRIRLWNDPSRSGDPHFDETFAWDNSTDLDEIAIWDVHSGTKANVGNIDIFDASITTVGETESIDIRGIPTDQIPRSTTEDYRVVAELSDGSETEITGLATEQSNATSILTVDDAGIATAMDASGHVRINASYQGLQTAVGTTVYNKTLEDIRFVDDPIAATVVLLDWGIWALLVVALFAAMGCDTIWEEEIAIMLFVAGVGVIWLLGMAGIYLPIGAVLIGGAVIFSPLGPPYS